jgi:hypothetical protein
MIRVYIASPYTVGDKLENVHRAMAAFDKLVKLGFAPYAPLLSHYQHERYPLPYDKWLELDIEWLKQCDFLIRLPGESAGADCECWTSKDNDIPFAIVNDEDINEKIVPMIFAMIERGKCEQ